MVEEESRAFLKAATLRGQGDLLTAPASSIFAVFIRFALDDTVSTHGYTAETKTFISLHPPPENGYLG